MIEELLFVKQFDVIIYVEENEQLKRQIERFKNRLTYRNYVSVKLATRG